MQKGECKNVCLNENECLFVTKLNGKRMQKAECENV